MSETSMPFRHLGVGQIAVVVHDLPRAVEFYRDTLGLRFLFDAGTLAFFDGGAVRIMLSLPEKPEFDHPCFVYYRVDDLDAAHHAMTERGVTFIEPPHLVAKMPDHELWMAFLRDPDLNFIALMAERPL